MAMMSLRRPPIGIGRRAGIGTVLQRDAVIDRPGQHDAEQDDPAEIAIGAQMRERPGFDADQHRMLEHTLDVAGHIGGDDHDARRPHQRDDDVARPGRRVPQHNEALGAVVGEAIADQNEADDRDQREQALVRAGADGGDQGLTPAAQADENMRAEKDNEPDDFDGKAHGAATSFWS